LLSRGFGRPALTEIAGGSIARVGANTLGLTTLDLPRGDFAEVFWDRCRNHDEVASSLFHEASHLRSRMGDEMHTFSFPGYGGVGLRVLRERGSAQKFPSYDDLLFYGRAVKRAVARQRDRVPATP
jgi:hypothetical protein